MSGLQGKGFLPDSAINKRRGLKRRVFGNERIGEDGKGTLFNSLLRYFTVFGIFFDTNIVAV